MDFFDRLIDCDDVVDFVRNDAIFKRDGHYFDWTASGLESRTISHRIATILPYYANTHSHSSANADFISTLYRQAKDKLRESLALAEDFLIIPSGFGASAAMKRFQEICGIYVPPALKRRIRVDSTPLVFVGPYEHHSNEISLREGLCECVRIPLKNGAIDMEWLDSALQNSTDSTQDSAPNNARREIFASLNIASNVSGIILPFEILSQRFRAIRAKVAFDLASISPHKNIDSTLFDAAFLSPHKLIGGIGSCGILIVRRDLLSPEIPPTFAGGGAIKYASKDSHYYIDDLEVREDAGTPPILGLLKAALAYQYRNEVGLDFIAKRENALYYLLLSELRDIPGIALYDTARDAPYLPIISLNIEGISPHNLAHALSYNYGIETRAGCSCAGPYGHDLLGLNTLTPSDLESNPALKPAWLRISLHYSHKFSDIEYLVDSIKKAVKMR